MKLKIVNDRGEQFFLDLPEQTYTEARLTVADLAFFLDGENLRDRVSRNEYWEVETKNGSFTLHVEE